VRRVGARGKVATETRTFRTMTDEILALGDWLRECGVTHVAMESTAVYPARPPARPRCAGRGGGLEADLQRAGGGL